MPGRKIRNRTNRVGAISRRHFLKTGIVVAGSALAGGGFSPFNKAADYSLLQSPAKILVIVHLFGGNDGLNTVVPYRDAAYYRARPTLAIAPNDVLRLDGRFGYHPNMKGLHELYEEGKVATVCGVGWQNQTRSHYRATEIWQTAEPNARISSRWYERRATRAIAAWDQCQDVELNRNNHTQFARDLKSVADNIVGCADSQIYNIKLAGFDTHADQTVNHAGLLQTMCDGIRAFQKNLTNNAVDEKVLLLVFSEFGRRLAENDAQGTDHGAAGPLFMVGSSVKGGLYGAQPDELSDSDEGDLPCAVDFRQVYATILDRWLMIDSKQIFGLNFKAIPFI